MRQYHGIPKEGPLSEEMARTLIHGYRACTSYTDAQIGRVLKELDRLGLRENTIVVLWGDHGWNLGEHTLWCKHCHFKTSLRTPLIVRAPGLRGGVKTEGLTEFVDIYPSLCELAGLPQPEHLEGRSFAPLLKEPGRVWKEAIYSRFYEGESVRTDRYCYTEWAKGNGPAHSRMLYDQQLDPDENVKFPRSRRMPGLSKNCRRSCTDSAPVIDRDWPRTRRVGSRPTRLRASMQGTRGLRTHPTKRMECRRIQWRFT